MDNNNEKSLIKRNRKKIIFCLLILFVIGFLLIAEYILKNTDLLLFNTRVKILNKGGSERYIVLREHRPLQSSKVYTSATVGKYSLVRLDENGFVIPSKVHNDPDIKMVFLGDSTTLVENAQEDKRFPYLVGRILEEKTGKKINSYNGAGNGNNSLHSINILLNKVLPLKPDFVVLMEVGMDLGVLVDNNTYWNKIEDRAPVIEIDNNFIKKLIIRKIKHILPNVGNEIQCFVDFIKGHYIHRQNKVSPSIINATDESAKKQQKEKTVDPQYICHEYEMNLQTFINICKARNITPVLMTQGNMFRDEETASKDKDSEIYKKLLRDAESLGMTFTQSNNLYFKFNQIIRDIGKKNNILVIDLDREIPKDDTNFCDAVHFKQKGSILAADIISNAFLADNNFKQLIKK
ncbi:MAG: SGNH/GDSL hydrolase family protein [Nitrospirae bacterium]|nr:SGNH/GDSL hydrolase family protein [Nitrospirota bacterium]